MGIWHFTENTLQSWTDMGIGTARPTIEWPTVMLLLLVHVLFAAIALNATALGPILTAISLSLVLALHSSLQHEVLHGHPFPDQKISELTVFLPLGLFIPYQRFKQTHLQHHFDPNLTDPYEDPETNFLDPRVWKRMSWLSRLAWRLHNTLLGRMTLGPLMTTGRFLYGDMLAIIRRDRSVIRAWSHHFAGLLVVFLLVSIYTDLTVGPYLAGAYGALSILRIRTFLEHRAHPRAAARSVVVEDRGLLALLFLNNNFHAVHHAHPRIAWYKLPGTYAARRADFLRRNHGYRYRSYAEIIALYLIRSKDPVPHPIWQSAKDPAASPEIKARTTEKMGA